MNTLPSSTACCNPCQSPQVIDIPGSSGTNGTNGTDGIDGVSAYTVTTAPFVVPAELGTVTIAVADSRWASIGQTLFIQTAGTYQVTALVNSVSMTVRNLMDTPNAAYLGNAVPTTVIATNSSVVASGLQGVGATNGGASGTGSPEGVVTGNPGRTYLDVTNDPPEFWAKYSGTGNTGWRKLIAILFMMAFVGQLVGQPLLRQSITTNSIQMAKSNIFTGSLDTNTTFPLTGWSIETPWSDWDVNQGNGFSNHVFRIRSLGQSATNDGGGDGYFQLQANTATKQSVWLGFNGALYFAPTNYWSNKLQVVGAVLSGSLANQNVTLSGSTGMLSSLSITFTGARYQIGQTPGTTSRSNYWISGRLFASITPTSNSGGGTNDLIYGVVPAGAISNNLDTIKFEATYRYALEAQPKTNSLMYGSSTLWTTGSQALSNVAVTVRGSIIGSSLATGQYLKGEALFTGLGGTTAFYLATNWTARLTETNWIDNRIYSRVTCAVANSITNESLEIWHQPKSDYTF